ncbi:MAG: hypothetical protein JXA22_07010 [Candidatus Thermoplasmatota archaeon]|nr:hypothetical protein [Candidatus Thermoplasmatota archaeon]
MFLPFERVTYLPGLYSSGQDGHIRKVTVKEHDMIDVGQGIEDSTLKEKGIPRPLT